MKRRIQHRLFFALLAASGLAVLCMFWIMQWSIGKGFLQYVNTMEQERLERLSVLLVDAYDQEGGWDFLRGPRGHWLQALMRTLPEGALEPELQRRFERHAGRHSERFPEWEGGPEPPPSSPPTASKRRPPPPPPERGFEARVFLLDVERSSVFGRISGESEGVLLTLESKGQTIGYLGLLPRRQLSEVQQLRFVKKQKTAMALIAGVVLLLSAILSLPLAKRLVRPIRELTYATHRLAGGDYAARVTVASTDELGQLARDFNALALTLEKNETARRQWVADISHELRTPIAILRGEIEALEDGVREPSPEAVQSLHAEVLHLGRLVEDLYQLSLSDVGAMTYRKEPVAVFALLKQVLESFRTEFTEKHVEFAVSLPDGEAPLVFADKERLRQLFANLLDNGLKYTDQHGRLEVRGRKEAGLVWLEFLDSAPGVPLEAMGKLFDRLFRVEASRSRSSGGAGLGLAICKNIVEAHEGTITAQPSPLGGLWVSVTLPVTGENA